MRRFPITTQSTGVAYNFNYNLIILSYLILIILENMKLFLGMNLHALCHVTRALQFSSQSGSTPPTRTGSPLCGARANPMNLQCFTPSNSISFNYLFCLINSFNYGPARPGPARILCL